MYINCYLFMQTRKPVEELISEDECYQSISELNGRIWTTSMYKVNVWSGLSLPKRKVATAPKLHRQSPLVNVKDARYEISVKFGDQDVTVPIDISMSDFFRRVIPNFSFSTLREGESLSMTWCVENGAVKSEWRLTPPDE